MGFGIGLGAAATSALSTYGTLKNIQSQGLRDDLMRQQLEQGKLDLQQKQEQATAARNLDDLAKQYFGGATVSDKGDGGPNAPGDAGNVKTPLNTEAMSDPVVMNKFMTAAAPHAMKMLGPEKGLAFIQSVQDNVKQMVPQAAQRFSIGDYAGGTALLKAGGGKQFQDLTNVTPVPAPTNGPEGEQPNSGLVRLDFGPNGSKGSTVVDPSVMLEYSLNPGKLLELTLQKRKVGAEEKTAGAAETKAQTDRMELPIKQKEADTKAQTAKNTADYQTAHLGILNAEAVTHAASVKSQDQARVATETLNETIRQAKSAQDAEGMAKKLLTKTDDLTGKETTSPLAQFLPSLMDKAQQATPKGGSVGATLQPMLATMIKNADTVGSQLALAAKKDDKGASLASEVRFALENGVPAQEVRVYGQHAGVSDQKMGTAIEAARKQQKAAAAPAAAPGGIGKPAADAADVNNIPGPPPKTIGTTDKASPSYIEWEKKYGDAWRAAQAEKAKADAVAARGLSAQYERTRGDNARGFGLGLRQ